MPAFGTPPLGTRTKDVGEIDLCGASEAKPRRLARALRSGRRQPFEVRFEIGVVDLDEIAVFERIDARPDLRAERFQPEAVFSSTPLKDAKGVANRFAGILVLASFDDLLNKRVLLGGQADVPGRHGLKCMLRRFSEDFGGGNSSIPCLLYDACQYRNSLFVQQRIR